MASGIIKAVATTQSTLRDVAFTIGLNAWASSNGVYTATINTPYVTTASKDFIEYDDSIRTSATSDISADKKEGAGGIVFTTNTMPVGEIRGHIYAIANDDGKTTVVVEDTVVPVGSGGTGATSASGARTNLGLGTAAVTDIYNNLDKTTEGFALDARQGKALADQIVTINTNISGFKFKFVNYLTRSTSITLSIPDSSKHLIIMISANADCNDIIYTYANNGGVTATKNAGSGVSLSTNGLSLTLSGTSTSSTTRIYLYDFVIEGNAI